VIFFFSSMIQLVFVDVTRFILFLSFSSELCFGIRGHFFLFSNAFLLARYKYSRYLYTA